MVLTGCSDSLFDKKLSETNYIEVLDELKEKNLITQDEYYIMHDYAEIIAMVRYGNPYGKSMATKEFGRPYDDITYRDIYNSKISRKKNE